MLNGRAVPVQKDFDRGVASQHREVLLPVRLHHECCVQFGIPQHKKDMNLEPRTKLVQAIEMTRY